jgi:hypothetical protein
MTTLTFILGMERFNAHVWAEVERLLQAGGAPVRLLRFNDDHVERQDPALAAAIAESEVVFITLINTRQNAEWLAGQLDRHPPKAVFVFESMPEAMALNRVGDYRVKGGKSALPKPMQLVLKLITQGRDEDTLYAYTKLSKISAKLLPFMPAKLHDFRTWLSTPAASLAALRRSAPHPSCCGSRRAASCSTRAGMRPCWRTATPGRPRSGTALPTCWAGARSAIVWSRGCSIRPPLRLCWMR